MNTDPVDRVCEFFDQVTPGTWPDWISATFSSLAFMVAAFSYRRSVRANRTAQAKLVYSVSALERVDAGTPVELASSGSRSGVYLDIWDEAGDNASFPVDVARSLVVVHNNSNEVISNVHVRLLMDYVDLPDKKDRDEWAATPQATSRLPDDLEDTFAAIAPGQTESVFLGTRDVWRGGAHNDWYLRMGVTAQITFTDSDGRHWSRKGAKPIKHKLGNPHRAVYSATALG